MRDSFVDEDEIIDEEGAELFEPIKAGAARSSQAWRTIEHYREMKELRKHLDDFRFDDISNRHLKDLHL